MSLAFRAAFSCWSSAATLTPLFLSITWPRARALATLSSRFSWERWFFRFFLTAGAGPDGGISRETKMLKGTQNAQVPERATLRARSIHLPYETTQAFRSHGADCL